MEKYILCIFSSGMVKHFSLIISKNVFSFLPSFPQCWRVDAEPCVLKASAKELCSSLFILFIFELFIFFFSFLILVVLAVFSYLASCLLYFGILSLVCSRYFVDKRMSWCTLRCTCAFCLLLMWRKPLVKPSCVTISICVDILFISIFSCFEYLILYLILIKTLL